MKDLTIDTFTRCEQPDIGEALRPVIDSAWGFDVSGEV